LYPFGAICLIASLLQAAAAARIAGKADIFTAAENGDVALVQDHITADAACVGKQDGM